MNGTPQDERKKFATFVSRGREITVSSEGIGIAIDPVTLEARASAFWKRYRRCVSNDSIMLQKGYATQR